MVREGKKKVGKMDRRISGRSKRASRNGVRGRIEREKRGRKERVARKGIRESEMLPW